MSRYDAAKNHRASAKMWRLVIASSLVALFAGIDMLFMWFANEELWSERNALLVGLLLLANFGVTLFRFQYLSADGSLLAEPLDGTLVDLDPHTDGLKQLRDITSELSIASALPMPALFVLESDSRINAIAESLAPAKTAIYVTQGALARLTREELKGLIAHEMAHLKHAHLARPAWLSAAYFGLFALAIVGVFLLKVVAVSGGDEAIEKRAGLMVASVVILPVGGLGWLLAAALVAKISRRQEFAADAEAARLMGTPDGIVGTLVKLARETGVIPDDSLTEPLGGLKPMHFRASRKRHWFDSHPPLLERIRALETAAMDESER